MFFSTCSLYYTIIIHIQICLIFLDSLCGREPDTIYISFFWRLSILGIGTIKNDLLTAEPKKKKKNQKNNIK